MRQAETRFIGGEKLWESGSVSHKAADKVLRGFRACWLLKADANEAGANAKFGAILEHSSADAFFVQEGAVRGVQVLQVGKILTHLKKAVMTRNLLIIQSNICIIAA